MDLQFWRHRKHTDWTRKIQIKCWLVIFWDENNIVIFVLPRSPCTGYRRVGSLGEGGGESAQAQFTNRWHGNCTEGMNRSLCRLRVLNQDLGDPYAESRQTLQGSFSAVPKPNFARKYALESSRRDLHNVRLCTVLEAQIVIQNSR